MGQYACNNIHLAYFMNQVIYRGVFPQKLQEFLPNLGPYGSGRSSSFVGLIKRLVGWYNYKIVTIYASFKFLSVVTIVGGHLYLPILPGKLIWLTKRYSAVFIIETTGRNGKPPLWALHKPYHCPVWLSDDSNGHLTPDEDWTWVIILLTWLISLSR